MTTKQQVEKANEAAGVSVEIIAFADKEWKEIPEQDNPAFINYGTDKKNRCLMIVKASSWHKIGVPHGFKVLDIDNPENVGDRVLGLGVFYQYKDAHLFAEAYAKQIGGSNV